MRNAAMSFVLLAACACAPGDEPATPAPQQEAQPMVQVDPFGTLPDGRAVHRYTLRNAHGTTVRAIDYGGIITELLVPDREGVLGDVALGYDSLDGYLEVSPYFGAIIGRYGNRIAGARFELDGVEHPLAANNGPNHLHGGVRGFDKVLWRAEPLAAEAGNGVVFRYRSVAGEEGYPGTLDVEVTYRLTGDDELIFEYTATTDAATPVNLTQHTYFNLGGGGDVLGHRLQLFADRYTPVDETLIPTGELAPVEGTPFDFRSATAIGARIGAGDAQLHHGGGYDHNFVLSGARPPTAVTERLGADLVHAAQLSEPGSGRVMDVYTTEPGIQFYSGNFLDGTITGKGSLVYGHRSGLCLETQHYPDSPNQPEFPSTILRPGQEYRTRTVYAFSAR